MEKDHPPFKSELENHPDILNEVSKFYALKDRPGYVVKEFRTAMVAEMFEESSDERRETESDVEFLTRVGAHGQQLQREFSQSTGIDTVNSQLAIGANEAGEKVMYRLTEQVLGDDLRDTLAGEHPTNAELETHIRSIYDYYKAKLESGKDYIADVGGLSQYRYGRTVNDPETKLYLVDTDPFYDRGEQVDGSQAGYTRFRLGHQIYRLVETIEEIQATRPDFAPDLHIEIDAFVRERTS